jgi:hypothetical protein
VTAPSDGAEVDPGDLTVKSNDVTTTVDSEPVTISGYEVIITKYELEVLALERSGNQTISVSFFTTE